MMWSDSDLSAAFFYSLSRDLKESLNFLQVNKEKVSVQGTNTQSVIGNVKFKAKRVLTPGSTKRKALSSLSSSSSSSSSYSSSTTLTSSEPNENDDYKKKKHKKENFKPRRG